jgi:hypothetical protein
MGWRSFRSSSANECYACKRPIHAHTRTVALVNGRLEQFCCPACALSEHEQEGKPVRVTQLTSFLTGASLSPDSAYLVKGSDINMCAMSHGMIDADKQTADVHYDRCAPSLLAFAQQSEAADFARQHGGEVLAFKDAAAAFTK